MANKRLSILDSYSNACLAGSTASRQPVAGGRPCRRQARPFARPALLAIAAGCLVLAGCSSAPKQAYPETFKDTNTYSRSYPASDAATCEAARRALLSQGYTIGKAQTDGVEGQKNFQIQEDEKQHQVISFHVVCTSDHQSSPNTTVFVNAVQDRYIIKKTGSSAGVGLSVLGSVSMPFGSYDDSLSKISSETISASSFYDGFFDLLQRYLPDSKATGGAPSKAPAGAKTPADGKVPADAKAPADAQAPALPASSPAAPATSTPPASSSTPASSSNPASPSSTSSPDAPASGASKPSNSQSPAAAPPAPDAPASGQPKPADSSGAGATPAP